ncbi:MAG: glucose-6-phosphate isomerase, partial [Lactobacillus sp.]|nr:glucose-6-phosphate isomerase [Lactobacillus sp.]
MKTKIYKSRPWKKLEAHSKSIKKHHMRDFFKADPDRAEKLSIKFEDILFDYSKNQITEKTLKFLVTLAKHAKLEDHVKAMFSGEKINFTEDRAVLHTALRN